MINKNAKDKKELTPIEKLEVVKVTYVSPELDRTRILFNGIIDDKIRVNGFSYVEIMKDGKEVHFVSMPSERGKDGKWYNKISCFVPNTVIESVKAQIEKALEE